jgi:excisionase family DNA binding protein
MGVIGTDEASRRLGVTPSRLTAMIRTGIIRAQKIGRTWVLEESEVARVAKLERKAGRPPKKRKQ